MPPAPSPAAEDPVLDALIVGAGLAGLSAARDLQDAGWRVQVVDKGRGVGGRCATRRVEGQPVDHGAPFLHGLDPALLALARAVPGGCLEGWPARVQGRGAPCHPDSFAVGGFRCAFSAGMTALPKHLAQGLDLRLSTKITTIAEDEGAVVIFDESGQCFRARTLVLALPVEQALALLCTLPGAGPAATARAMLGWFRSEPALSLIAGYAPDCADPGFDLLLPDADSPLQLVVADSAKRAVAPSRVMVYQARPSWAAAHLEEPPEVWAPALLQAAGALLGPWALRPAWTSTHRWRHARLVGGPGLRDVLTLTLPQGGRLAFAGEAFDPHGGLEGAWRSGRHLAARLLEGPRALEAP